MMDGTEGEDSPKVYDLSAYTTEELMHLWSSPDGLADEGLLAAALMNETVNAMVLSRMVADPMDVLTGGNVNWAMLNLTELVLLTLLPKVDVSQKGGALLVLGWIQWVKGRFDLAMETLQTIDEDTDFRSTLTTVLYKKVASSIQPESMLDRPDN